MSHSPELRRNILTALAAGIPLRHVRDRYRQPNGELVPERTIAGWTANEPQRLEQRAQYDEAFARLESANPTMGQIAEDLRRSFQPTPTPGLNLHAPSLVMPPAPGIIVPRASFEDEPEGTRIIVIGDTQVKPNIDLGFLDRIGRYCAYKKPPVIVQIGDFADMGSCSFHEKEGSKTYAEQNYRADIMAVHMGMRTLMRPIQEEMDRSGWNPRLVLTLGNHEIRINRVIEAIPKLDGTIGLPDLEYERWGWEVVPFMQAIEIERVVFQHYFASGVMGRPITTAKALLIKMHMSCVAGHQPGFDIATSQAANQRTITGIINGASYEHDEKHLSPQTNNHFRGITVLNDVRQGMFETMPVSLRWLRRKYGQ